MTKPHFEEKLRALCLRDTNLPADDPDRRYVSFVLDATPSLLRLIAAARDMDGEAIMLDGSQHYAIVPERIDELVAALADLDRGVGG